MVETKNLLPAKLLPVTVAALGIEACWLALRCVDHLRFEIVHTITCLLSTSLVYLVSVYWISSDSHRLRGNHVGVFILAAAVVFRLTVWPLYPAFSNDVYRYHWEGKLQVEGHGNPYLVAPSDPAYAALRDSTYGNVVLPDNKTIYGPVIELEQRAWYWVLQTFGVTNPFVRVFWFKAPAALFDLLTIGVVWLWLRARGDPVERVLIYAWCPLPVFEFWVNGHNDSLLICFLAMALWLDTRGRYGWSAASLAMSAATKLWPAVLWPWILMRRGWRSALGAAVPVALLSAPYVADVVENAQYASGFLGGWRNNDSLYGLILWACQGDIYRAKYATFAILACVVSIVLWKKLPFAEAALVIITAMLAISANVHPWYLTWIVPLLVVNPAAPLLLWVALVPLHYVVLIGYHTLGVWNGVESSRWFVYAPVYAFALICGLISRFRTASRATDSGR